MKQIEITVRLNERMQEAIRKLEMQGFEKIRESEIDDIYMTSKLKELNENNIQNILKKSVLLRSLKLENKEIKKIMEEAPNGVNIKPRSKFRKDTRIEKY